MCYNTDRNQEQRSGKPFARNKEVRSPSQHKTQAPGRSVFPAKCVLDLKTLKKMESADVVHKLNESIARFEYLLRSEEEQHNSDEFIMDLTWILAIVCNGPSSERKIKILAALKGSIFLKSKVPCLLDRIECSSTFNDQEPQRRLIQWLIKIFKESLTHIPSSYADLPYEQLKRALEKSNIDGKCGVANELEAFKQIRDNIIAAERQKHGRRYVNKAGHKPPNDFRDMPICPTNEEIKSQERPYLRKNITKGRYEDAEHYLDVQFRLLREDFLEPLREGIHEIVQNVPRRQRNQFMKYYPGANIVYKRFTQSGIIYHVQFDISRFDTKRWASSKRLMYGSFLCLSKDNFETMLFATVARRDPEMLKNGKIDIQFIEEQDVFGIEHRNCEYQMVESPAYFEAYRHVLKGLKELDETTLPFKKYLVECSADVDPPEYLRCEYTQEPVCYDISRALDVPDAASANRVPVLQLEAWPSVERLSLNNSQYEALKTAVTTEFSVIQGPPGTGKTYVGAKIVRCLLENRTSWDPDGISPMLMVCYTNHALDQFLEKVLEFLPREEIIRVGGRSKSRHLEECNLKLFRNEYRLDERRREVRTLQMRKDGKVRETRRCKKLLENADTKLLEFDDLEEFLNSEHTEQIYAAIFPPKAANKYQKPGNTFKLWLCSNKEMDRLNQSTTTKTNHQVENNQDGCFLRDRQFGENDEVLIDATLLPAPDDTVESRTDNQLPCKTGCWEVAHNKKAYPKEPSQINLLWEDNASKFVTPSYLERKEDSSSEQHEWTQNVKATSCEEFEEAFEETIAVEKEADLIQNQRSIHGDETFSPVMETFSGELLSNPERKHQDMGRGKDGEWTTVSYRKMGDKKPWEQTAGGSSKDKGRATHNVENIAKPKTSEVGGTRDQDKNREIDITADIQSLKDDLQKEMIMSTIEAMDVKNIWLLSRSSRLQLYLFWVESYRERYRVEIQRNEQEYEQLCREQEAIRYEEEEEVIRRATVVGMTTTGAAKYHSVLQRVAPKIVVIEEAAEVMEAHIITSLSHDTKHTILIGDHKQLRPKATVYELAQKYNLEISLFERMVMNNMDCKRLCIQHRMSPEIAALTKRIYDHDIFDHETVCQFENISGLTRNLFFIDHCELEVLVQGLQSYANPHEAAFLVALCNHLLIQGYRPSQITILTMYTGQLLLLQQNMPKRLYEGVKVCAVDNFQGEENDIILLSLVRSNSEGRIGFLNESNRICVALSRARQGFYCIGNFKLLKSQCNLWKEICNDLEAKEAIGVTLQLICKRHQSVTNVGTSHEFNIYGGCNKPCGVRLVCGHACETPCHAADYFHENNVCSKQCLMICCSNEHRCQHRCHYRARCPKCYVPMLKRIPQCGHEQSVPCQTDPVDFSCKEKCDKILPCGHNCQDLCGKLCTQPCKIDCKKMLPCGHEKCMPCFKDPLMAKCNSNCTKVLGCGHPCSEKCKKACKCNTEVEVELACSHRRLVLCPTKDRLPPCVERCIKNLSCGHVCPGMCYEDCGMKKCEVEVYKWLPCGHQQSIPCHLNPKKAFCYAPCQRKLDCGHKCPSVCGRICHEVPCQESCQIKCKRGHACRQRCHFGSSCADCMVVVDMTIPQCGHSITKPCNLNLSAFRCEKPCENVRVCGHSCQDTCGKNCEAQPCKKLVTTALPCGHEATLPCHKNPEKYTCKEILEMDLSCGHKKSLYCHVAKAGTDNVKCNVKIEKELPCKHKLYLPCHKNPKECKCKKKVDVQLSCGHRKSLICFTVTTDLQNVNCMFKIKRKLPCEHEATFPCYLNLEDHCCLEETQITLSCGHKKLTTCSEWRGGLQGEPCSQTVTRKLPCGHEKEMLCSDKPENVFCNVSCERFLPCKHSCAKQCGDDCASFKCVVTVEKDLPCGYHKISCLCSDDVSQLICSNGCRRMLSCGHKCPGKCSETCIQNKCQTLVVRHLQCAGNHSLRMRCSDDPNAAICPERCSQNLNCGHPCPGLCSDDCGSMKCIRRIEKKFPCGHQESLKCFQIKAATCTAPCRRRKASCKHICKGLCGQDCSKYPCNVAVVKALSCGHKIKLLCHQSADDIECLSPCEARLPCGHQCSGTCKDCQQSGTHELCQRPCGRFLVCSHRCKGICSEPCPPCDRKCGRRCPHYKCTERCSQLCEPCNKPCTWTCPHHQCDNLCGEECNRPPCNVPCPKKLACRHPCIGLCGENCPTVCSICHAKKLSSVLRDGRGKKTEATRCLQLLDCSHIVTVAEMDVWVLREQDSEIQLMRCPRCSTSITFSYRYGNLVKRTLKKVENVKKQVLELADIAATASSSFLRDDSIFADDVGIPVDDVMMMKFPREFLSMVVDDCIDWRYAHGRAIPLMFTLKNHLRIMHLAEKGNRLLQSIANDQEASNQPLEFKELLRTSGNALRKVKKYLEKPQLDLKTLNQVHEHTRKIFLFSSILEAQSIAIKFHTSFSSIGESRMQLARSALNLFLQGNNEAVHLDWLERIVSLLRKEANLPPLPPVKSYYFENFPGFNRDVWKLCQRLHVYCTRFILENGEFNKVESEGCSQCAVIETRDKLQNIVQDDFN